MATDFKKLVLISPSKKCLVKFRNGVWQLVNAEQQKAVDVFHTLADARVVVAKL